MKLAVISYKLCWVSTDSPSGYATDGGFPFQMQALSELFDSTILVLPGSSPGNPSGETPLTGRNLSVVPLKPPFGRSILRKLFFPLWFAGNGFILIREILRADAVHAVVPGDIGTAGALLAFILKRPLLVRYCGNWFAQNTPAERFLRWFMENLTGERNVILATGAGLKPPSGRNPNIRWIFSTSLTEKELNSCFVNRDRLLPGPCRLITVARQEKAKGTETLIQSLPLIAEDFPEALLDIVGDGPALPELKRSAVSLGLRERVNFHGRLSHREVIRLLQQADIFCLPTTTEGFPKAVLEALACGLPVITTPVSVLPELIGTDCGILIKEITAEAIADAVKVILSDPNRYKIISKQAAQKARQYSLEQWQQAIGAMLQRAWGRLRSEI